MVLCTIGARSRFSPFHLRLELEADARAVAFGCERAFSGFARNAKTSLGGRSITISFDACGMARSVDGRWSRK
jgi:hypothetical protein